ncbi:laminin subunit gamma-1-like [Rhopilema esculentum]|uniref:laminin subunit gamma-1-like n=1 Tax=Rhopilema esculentum TaxID=499914 RepID=UPI0031DB01FA|eukprot:gene10477-19187_t
MMYKLVRFAITLQLLPFCFKIAESTCTNNAPCTPPPPQNLLRDGRTNQTYISVSAPCGNPVEEFCSPTTCGLFCNASDPNRRYQIQDMIDAESNPTYWKSKNFDAPVTIQIDLNQKLLLHQVTVIFEFDYPSYVFIERSQDFGRSYGLIHHSAINCLTSSGISPSTSYRAKLPVCMEISLTLSPKAVSYMPRTDETIMNQIQTDLTVRDYFIFTNLRYVLSSYRTPPGFDRNSAQLKYYFAIKNFDLQGSCYCNGMGDQCSASNNSKCICQKNTQGDNCQECQPFFNNKPWRYGIACESCNCSSLATSCVYDAAKGHGVCQNCTRNTTGDFCNQCLSGFHRNPQRICVDCGCDLRGVSVSGRICNETTGLCNCKQNVQGSKCDTCKEQFWGLNMSNANGCNACGCMAWATVNGSNICDSHTGQCSCRLGFAGRTCNQCRVDYYSIQSVNPTQCTACLCNPSGSMNTSCSNTGSCYCRPNYSGEKCEVLASGYYSASVSQLLFSSLQAVVSSSAAFYSSSSRFVNSRGSVFHYVGYSLGLDVRTRTSTVLSFSMTLPATTGYEFVLRYLSSYTFSNTMLTISRQFAFQPYACQMDGSTEQITVGGNIVLYNNLPFNNQSRSFGSVCLSQGAYSISLSIPFNSSVANARILVTSLLVLPSYRYSALYMAANTTTQSRIRFYYNQAYSQSSWSVYQAEGAFYMGYLYGAVVSSSQSCQCNNIGSITTASCDQYGGQCRCKANVTGLRCDSCLPNHANFSSGLGCSACGCHPFGSQNTSCHPQTGQCFCEANVVGAKCDQCRSDYHGVNTGRGCVPCNCSSVYASRQQCYENGTCACKQGIGGEKCSQCLPGFHTLTTSGCTRCSCNPIGSVNSVCNTSSASCHCKPNTSGPSCSQCRPSYYGYSNQFPDICIRCYCSGKTQQCTTARGFFHTTINTTLLTTVNNVALDGWTSVNGNGFASGSLFLSWFGPFRGSVQLQNTREESELFFVAPSKYLGDKRASYMLSLTFLLSQDTTNQPINSSLGDVILRGNNASYTLVTKLNAAPLQHPSFRSYKVMFQERYWAKNQIGGASVTSEEFIAVISNLRSLHIRGKWTTASRQSSYLANIQMEYSTNTAVSSNASYNVENCSCPLGYTGLSCERCDRGYTRSTPYGAASTSCVPCRCNNHSSTCNPVNGVCDQCQHSTTGTNCQSCRAGYYGNATQGTPLDCSPCRCPGGPGASNQYSPVCALANDGSPNCTACESGYKGRRCEMCQEGFFGNPLIPGRRCVQCQCSGNSLSCNNATGECMNCLYNTTGFNCERCRNGTYGNALSTNPVKCQDCNCDAIGSPSNTCNSITGRCSCKTNVYGRTCNQCVPNSYNFSSGVGCTLCHCNTFGSANLQCRNNGTCHCKARVTGEKCDRCMPGYYNLAAGCLPCNCSSNYTIENTTCNANTGLCQCKSTTSGGRYGGRQCSQCGSNAFGTPPNCELCVEECYNNWNGYISTETGRLANLMANTSALLARFGSMSYSQINTEIQILNNNLTYASTVFEGAQYDTRAKEAQFRQIETSIITFESSVNRSNEQLQSLEQYFTATRSFNGVVNLDSSTPSSFPSPFTNLQVTSLTFSVPATASPASITTMAQGYLSSSNANNASATILYSTILQNHNQIQTANQSINQAASDISASMARLFQAATERARASTFLDASFQTTFQANAVELQQINSLVQGIKKLLDSTATTHSEATQLLSTAQATMTTAESILNTSRNQANAASQAASEMLLSGSSLQANTQQTQSLAIRLKSNADALLYDAQQTTSSVATSINKVATIRNQTEEATRTANQAINQTLPVSLSRIQSLSAQIMATTINESQINQTLKGATDGLRRAQEVQILSQQAQNSSQSTLANIQSVEASLLSAETLQNSTRQMHLDNDKKVTEIKNISRTVESQFRGLQGTGQQVLALVNSTITQVNDSLMCFANAKSTVDNATSIAQSAQSLSTSALLIHQSNTQRITSYSTQINTAHATTTAQYSEVQKVQANATQLLSDVTEAERLLAQVIEQNSELTRLQAESAALETELDALITKYDQAVAKFSTCSRN